MHKLIFCYLWVLRVWARRPTTTHYLMVRWLLIHCQIHRSRREDILSMIWWQSTKCR